jgi:hypothetical protein
MPSDFQANRQSARAGRFRGEKNSDVEAPKGRAALGLKHRDMTGAKVEKRKYHNPYSTHDPHIPRKDIIV